MVLEKIRQLYPELTKSQKRLADFVAVSYQEAAFMTASKLARRVAVNEATVIRFAQRLGYAGYPALIDDIQAIVRDELKPQSEMQRAPGREEPFFAVLDAEVESLQRGISHILPEHAMQALTMLRQAQRIHVVGQGLGAPLAQLFGLSLRAIGYPSGCPQFDPAGLAISLEGMAEGSVLVAISVSGETLVTANALRYAAQQGARTLAITWSPLDSCAQVAEVAISCPASSQFALPSVALVATWIDALVQTLASVDRAGLQSRAERITLAEQAILSRRRR